MSEAVTIERTRAPRLGETGQASGAGSGSGTKTTIDFRTRVFRALRFAQRLGVDPAAGGVTIPEDFPVEYGPPRRAPGSDQVERRPCISIVRPDVYARRLVEDLSFDVNDRTRWPAIASAVGRASRLYQRLREDGLIEPIENPDAGAAHVANEDAGDQTLPPLPE